MLVTGTTGVAGYCALDYFWRRYPGQVFGLRPRGNRQLRGPQFLSCNIEDAGQLARIFRDHPFRTVLNCAGNCALKTCELDPRVAWTVNVEGVSNLVQQTVPRDIRLVHLSVDLVFSGDKEGGYTEADRPDPVTVYGKTMVVGEDLVQERDPRACILRISLPMGPSPGGHAGAIDWIESRFRNGRPATLYYDEIRRPTYCDDLNRLFEHMIAAPCAGIFHAGGPRTMSLYEIAQTINRVGGYAADLLFGMPRREAGPLPPRAGNVAMDGSKLTDTLGFDPFDPWPLDPAMVPTDRRWHHDRPPDKPRGPEILWSTLGENPALGRVDQQSAAV